MLQENSNRSQLAHREDLKQRIRGLCAPFPIDPVDVPPRLPQMAGMKAVLFDVYGTIFGAQPANDVPGRRYIVPAAFTAALCSAGFRVLDPAVAGCIEHYEEIGRTLGGRLRAAGISDPERDVRDLWRVMLEPPINAGQLDGELSMAQIERLAVEYEFRVYPMWPVPHLLETLTGLQQKGVRLGIVSNAQYFCPLFIEALTERSMQQLGFDPSIVVWSYELGMRKPAAQLFEKPLQVLARDGIPSEQVLYVGNDMRTDIRPAMEFGMKTALFVGDKQAWTLKGDEQEAALSVPDAVLTDLRQLHQII